MPFIIFKYLSKQVLQVLLAVSSVVLLILMSGRFVNYLTQAAEGQIKADFLFLIMAYRIPEFLVMILPLGLFLGIILSYGRLYVDNEMSIFSACGLSQNQLLKLTMGPACVVMVVVGILSLYVAPMGIHQVESILAKQDTLTAFDTMVPGRFQVLGNGSRTTYAESLSNNKKTMEQVFIANRTASNEKTGSITLVLANTANLTTRKEGVRYLILHNGYRYDLTPGLPNVTTIKYKTYGLKMPNHKVPEAVAREQALPTTALLGSNDPRYIAELQWRLSLPFLVPIIVLLAIPLARVSPRQGRFVKLLPALLLYLFYIMTLIALRGAVADGQISSLWGMWWIHVVYLCLALIIYFYEPARFAIAKRRAVSA
ncbi:MAG: LPS export ABC transporter permease LptF [Endozoicomonas sp. (ex Botrylloides leachii)]|nr:LPS export ABC transporter permease LptF [Endozoicomonas sp. (ex Botrylloides leachii)]